MDLSKLNNRHSVTIQKNCLGAGNQTAKDHGKDRNGRLDNITKSSVVIGILDEGDSLVQDY